MKLLSLFFLFCTTVSNAQLVIGKLPGPLVDQAHCGHYHKYRMVNGKPEIVLQYACDFEYALRRHDPTEQGKDPFGMSRPTGLEKTPADSVENINEVAGITPEGGYNLYSNFSYGNGVTLHGGTASRSRIEGLGSFAWSAARMYSTVPQEFLPGMRAAQRGRLEKAKIDGIKGENEARLRVLQSNSDKLSSAQGAHLASNLKASVGYSVEAVRDLAEMLPATLEPIVDATPAGGEPKKTIVPTADDLVAYGAIRQLEDSLASRVAENELSLLEELADLVRGEDEASFASDGPAVRQLYASYYDENGLLGAKVLGKELGTRAESLGKLLATSNQTWEGAAVRRQINRGLIAVKNSTSEEKTQLAYGGISLATAADLAFADGAKEAVGSPESIKRQQAGREFLKQAAGQIDFALGLLPGVGTALESAHILHGLATGYDLLGNPMSGSDYGLRGLNMVASVFGLGAPLKAVMRIGAHSIKQSFILGSRVIRKIRGGGEALYEAARNSPARDWSIRNTAETIGEHPALLDKEHGVTLETLTEELSRFKQVGHAVSEAAQNKLKFVSDESLEYHFQKHIKEFPKAYKDSASYLARANEVVSSGTFVKKFRFEGFEHEGGGFAKLMEEGSGENVAFVGLNADHSKILTFHIKKLKKIGKHFSDWRIEPKT